MEHEAPDRGVSGSGVTARPRRTRLVRWVRPTRGYVIAAAATGGLVAIAGIMPQLWFVWSASAPRPPGALGWSLVSMTLLVFGAAVMTWTAAWPKPRVPGDDPGRARDRGERRIVRRAVWRAEPPPHLRLARVAARALAARDEARVGASFAVLGSGLLLGLGTYGDVVDLSSPSTLIGLWWTVLGVLMLLVGWLPRRLLHRLDTAWRARPDR